MKYLTIACGVLVACSAWAAASETPQNGIMEAKGRRERIQKIIAERNEANAKIDTDFRDGRRARQSCIADYQTLCGGSTDSGDKPAAAVVQQKEGEPPAPTAAPRGGRRGGRARRRLRLAGMERCLAERVGEITNARCKAYMEGRAVCFAEADRVCSADGKSAGAKKPKLSISDRLMSKENQKKAALGSAGDLAAARGGSAADVAAATAERSTVLCLRRSSTPTNDFSLECTNSTYFKSIFVTRGSKSKSRSVRKP